MTPYRHMVLADTGPLYAAIDSSDQYYRQARAELARLEESGVGVGVIVPTVSEAHTLVLYRLGPVIARRWLSELSAAATIIPILEDDFHVAIDIVQRYGDQPITLHDALLATVSTRLDIPVWTYDHHFDVMRSKRWQGMS